MKLLNKKNLQLNILSSQSSSKSYVSPAPSCVQSQNNQSSQQMKNLNHNLTHILKPLDNSPTQSDIQSISAQPITQQQISRQTNKIGNSPQEIEENQETEKEPYCSGLKKLSIAQASPYNPRSQSSFLKDNITQVATGIYLGNYRSAMDKDKITRARISHVINCSPSDCQNLFADELIYLNIAIQDNWKTNLFLVIYAILDFLNQALKAGGNVLIHCNQGISRSPSVVIAYLIYTEKITAEEALQKLKMKYPSADPNLDFQLQLNEMYIEATSKQLEFSSNSYSSSSINHLHNTPQINHPSSVVTLTTPQFSKQPLYQDQFINRTKKTSSENIILESQDKLIKTQEHNQDSSNNSLTIAKSFNSSRQDLSETFSSVNTSMSSACNSNTTELSHFALQDIEIL